MLDLTSSDVKGQLIALRARKIYEKTAGTFKVPLQPWTELPTGMRQDFEYLAQDTTIIVNREPCTDEISFWDKGIKPLTTVFWVIVFMFVAFIFGIGQGGKAVERRIRDAQRNRPVAAQIQAQH